MTRVVPGRSRTKSGRVRAALLLGLFAAAAAAQPRDVVVEPIVDLIEALRARGITVIYGSDLLPESLLTEHEAGAEPGLALLESALRMHGLMLQPGPQGSWLVVSEPESAVPVEGRPPVAPEFVPPIGRPALETVVVSASRYTFSRTDGPSTVQIDRTKLQYGPALGSDTLRAAHGLPGLTSSGLTARVNVRGGNLDESLIYLDGVRLYDPFHLKNFQGLFSSIDPNIVGSMAVFTGAYPAEYGDRMSAVVDIESVVPSEDGLFEAGVSTLTTSFFGMGRFGDGKGGWVASARRGNLDLLIDAARTGLGIPRYVDVFSKLEFDLSSSLRVYGGLLGLDDEVVLNDVGIGTAEADYSDGYAWAGIAFTGSILDLDILFSGADLSARRNGNVDDPSGSIGTLLDIRDFEGWGAQLDWSVRISDAHSVRGGVEVRDQSAAYTFSSTRTDRLEIATGLPRPPSMIAAALELDGTHRSAYLGYRYRASDSVTMEVSVRRDSQSLPADSEISPRFNILYDVNDRLSIRGAWGRYFQSEGLHELQVSDGVTSLFPAQQAKHTVLGVEYSLMPNLSLRLEAFKKEFEQLRPRFENLFTRVALIPELEPDRVMLAPTQGEAMGIEVSIGGGRNDLSWWFNLSRSQAEDDLEGLTVRRSWDEPWSLKGGLLWTGPEWTVSLATTWHTGWPISELTLVDGEFVTSEPNTVRLRNFSSIDVRASRSRQLRRGELEWFVEVSNALDRQNPCCIEHTVEFGPTGQPIGLDRVSNHWLGLVPTIGFAWRVGRGAR